MELGHERVVHVEHVRRLDVLGLGRPHQQTLLLLAHRQRLQRPDQVLAGDVRLLLDLVVRQPLPVVEQHQHAHLERVTPIRNCGDRLKDKAIYLVRGQLQDVLPGRAERHRRGWSGNGRHDGGTAAATLGTFLLGLDAVELGVHVHGACWDWKFR